VSSDIGGAGRAVHRGIHDYCWRLVLFALVVSVMGSVLSVPARAEGVGSSVAMNSWLFVAPTSSVPADGVAVFTATVAVATQDVHRKAVEGVVATFRALPEDVMFSAPICTTDAFGMCSVTFTSTVAGSYQIIATIGGKSVRLSLTPVVFTVPTASGDA